MTHTHTCLYCGSALSPFQTLQKGENWRGIAADMGYEPLAHKNVRPRNDWIVDRIKMFKHKAAEELLRSNYPALMDVLEERLRQVEKEGWTTDHDDAHEAGELVAAAATYALSAVLPGLRTRWFSRFWPWDRGWFKPKNPRRDLIRATALMLAEIDRMDRAAAKLEEHEDV